MLRIVVALSGLCTLVSSCGDPLEEAKSASNAETTESMPLPNAGAPHAPGNQGSSNNPTSSAGTGKAAGASCLTDCDNGTWKKFFAETLPVANAINIEGCTLQQAAVF